MAPVTATNLVTGPAREPLSLYEAKQHLRVDDNDDDDEIDGLIQEARVYVERITGRKLITQTWELKLDRFYETVKIPYPPLQSIESITYKDSSNVTQTLSSAYYIVDTDNEPARVKEAYAYEYPDTYDDINAVTIQFKSGYADDPEDVPERFKRAMKLYIQWMYDGEKVAKEAMDSIIMQDRIEWL